MRPRRPFRCSSRLSGPWRTRARLLAPTLLLAAALGCDDEAQPPTTLEPATPVAASAAVTAALSFRQVSAGSFHTCGVTTDDRAYCWGVNNIGELGNGTTTGPETCALERACSKRPVAVLGGLRFRAVTAGAGHSCGVTFDDKAYCWGGNGLGMLGDGTNTDRARPVAVGGRLSFRQLSAGGAHTCGVTTDSRAYCWGSNFFGELGTREAYNAPVAVAGGLRFRLVSAGLSDFTCGITTADRAYCWGRNLSGELGDSTEVESRAVPAPVAGGRTYRELDAGSNHTCAVTFGSRAFCWGNGRDGQLGTGKTYLSFWPRPAAAGLSFDRVTAGYRHTCGEGTNNRVYCWGYNSHGQLGDGTTTNRPTAVAVLGGLFFAQATAGGFHTCAKTSGGVAYCWGRNQYGQLGDGTQGKRLTPTPVMGPS
jgi:alpha-tubulin suppressor-like RCC1 family protein